MIRARSIVLAAATATALVVVLVWGFAGNRGAGDEKDNDRPIGSASRVRRDRSGAVVLTLDAATQSRIGLQTVRLQAASLAGETTAYGKLEEDPGETFVVRAPAAGTLLRAAGREWPAWGETVARDTILGRIEPRLTPVDRVALLERLNTARADAAAYRASAQAAHAALERARALNADDKNMSDHALQEAEARAAGEDARLTAATDTERLIEAALQAGTGPAAAMPFSSQRGGQVVEILAQPGESVESGQAVLRLARFDRLVARVDVPAGEPAPRLPQSALLTVVGFEDHPVRARGIALASSAGPPSSGRGYLFRVEDRGREFRPGLAVTARLPLPGAARRGVIVPGASLVRHMGRVWAYVASGASTYTRRELSDVEATPGGWFTVSLAPGDRIVTSGAQTLLSEEFKSQIQMGEEE